MQVLSDTLELRESNSVFRKFSSKFSNKETNILFWNYNPFRKGPKRIAGRKDFCDSTINFSDPIKKNLKCLKGSRLRKGEANDTKPNIARFMQLRIEIKKLQMEYKDKNNNIENKIIIKDRNKLASKICRLKKKAFQDSAKIKYALLGIEIDELSFILSYLRKMVNENILKEDIESWIAKIHETRVAGRLDEAIKEMIEFEDVGQQHYLTSKLNTLNNCEDNIMAITNTEPCSSQYVFDDKSHSTELSQQYYCKGSENW